MKLPWLKKPTDSLEELESQLEAARAACQSAGAEVAQALAHFDVAGDDRAAQALREAREREALAREHEGRAQRLVDAAQDRLRAERRAELEAEASDLEDAISAAAVDAVSAPLLEAEVELLIQLARRRLQRRQVGRDLDDKRRKLAHVRRQLGVEDNHRAGDGPGAVVASKFRLLEASMLPALR